MSTTKCNQDFPDPEIQSPVGSQDKSETSNMKWWPCTLATSYDHYFLIDQFAGWSVQPA